MAAFLSREALLAAFVEETAAKACTWGESDCAMMAAEWVARARGLDASRIIRGRYRDALTARRLCKREGGFMSIVARSLDGAGLDRTDAPRTGDVGVIEVPSGETAGGVGGVMGIRFGGLWIVRAEQGVAARPWPFVAAWQV